LVDSVKETAHDISVKAKELEKSAEHKLEEAEKRGKNFEIKFVFEIFSFQLR
jgi:hypothetical protein